MNKTVLNDSIHFIKSWLELRYQQEEIPGFVVAISYEGKLLMNQAFGFANLEENIKLTSDNIFRIASHSKTFTSTALMQLQEKGELRIDDYIVDYLPWLSEHKDKRWQKVTIRQLMSHGAGVIRDGLDSDYWQLDKSFPNKEVLKNELLRSDLIIDNNTKLKYSNFGYSLLGMLVEKITGKSYNNYVDANIVTVLGLKSTGPEYKSIIKDNLAIGYSRRNVEKNRLPIANVDTKSMSSATGFYSTAKDLCTYFDAHFVGSGKLLDDESKKEMQKVQWHAETPGQSNHEDYGLGFEIEYLNKRKTISHGGGFPGYITKSIADPKDRLIVVVLTNCLGGPAVTIARSIFSIIDYYQDSVTKVKPKQDLSRFEGRYMNLWATLEIIDLGEKVVAFSPDNWRPLMEPEELEYVNDTTLKVVKTGSFDSEGELVQFKFKENKVESVNYNGSTMLPEKAWIEKQKQRSVIDLPI